MVSVRQQTVGKPKAPASQMRSAVFIEEEREDKRLHLDYAISHHMGETAALQNTENKMVALVMSPMKLMGQFHVKCDRNFPQTDSDPL